MSIEMNIVKEMDNYHYGWFCQLSVDFGGTKNTPRSDYYRFEKFENIFLSSEEMDEIRNQINYLLEEEEEENETVIDPFDGIDNSADTVDGT